MKNARRLGALERLRVQLASGDTDGNRASIPYIEKQIDTLEKRVKLPHSAMTETNKQYRGARR